jgi:hypothetical protein
VAQDNYGIPEHFLQILPFLLPLVYCELLSGAASDPAAQDYRSEPGSDGEPPFPICVVVDASRRELTLVDRLRGLWRGDGSRLPLPAGFAQPIE